MPSNHLILGFPRLILPSIFPSIRVFSNKLTPHIRCPKYWSFSFSISPSSECSGLISFKTDWFDLPAVQGTLKESSPAPQFEASILLHSAFFMVQLSHLYMTSGKIIDLTRRIFVSKAMSLLFNIMPTLKKKKKKVFVWLHQVSLSCGSWDLHWLLWDFWLWRMSSVNQQHMGP